MTLNSFIRLLHRWVSIVFTLTVVATFIALAQPAPIIWVSYLPLLPLALLALSGLFLFSLPYVSRWRRGRTAAGN